MKSPRFATTLLAVAALALAGCATEMPMPSGLARVAPPLAGTPLNRTAELTIYRPGKFFGAALRPTVRMNGTDLVSIASGKKFHTRLTPGKYLFDIDGHRSGAELDVKPGESYYFLITIEQGIFAGNGVLTLVAPQQGGFESQPLKSVDAGAVNAPAFR